MNTQESDFVVQIAIVAMIILGPTWAIYKRRFLRALREHERQTWEELGSPKPSLFSSPFKTQRTESYIAKKRWKELDSTEVIEIAKKVHIVQRVQLFVVGLIVLALFFPPLMESFSRVG
ncbi:MAG: hypothetical protein OQJ89_09625 [Kangiellaceae bacterium]|nr:hypothetical protein [Kangiellaceae bacterium]MCW8997220.1 hypothetical protein [Kangiellaceae bacterium]MCW9017213.1 hypothetical protein [Kangiellaceae bacterium]